jgi:LETM1 and EF-hand domain-containing protein 1
MVYFAQEEAKKDLMDQEEKGTIVEDESDERDRALRDKMLATAREAQQLAQTKTLDKRDELCKLSAALAVLASASSVSKERGEFLRLVKNEIQLYNSMIEKEGTDGAERLVMLSTTLPVKQ